ncbi:DEAD/DEAH box helicase [Fusibacter bizertensis]
MKINTIRYWHRLEHFYPYVLKEQNSPNINSYFISSEKDYEFLLYNLIPDDKIVRFYEVYLGIFKIDSAINVVNDRLRYKPRFKDESDDESCFCKFRIDAEKKIISKSFKLSSFPWAIQRVKENKIDLDNWDEDFHRFQTALTTALLNQKENVNFEYLLDIRNLFSESINWDIEFQPIWMRIDQVIMDKPTESTSENDLEIESDEILEVEDLVKANDLLNSFYVKDLEKILTDFKHEEPSNSALKWYLEFKENNKINIEEDEKAILKHFNPDFLPSSRWPSDYNLRAMQQLAVNTYLSNELYDKSIFSVNGPPGTGKTTLLKDVIAGIIFERSNWLSKLKSPDDAFEGGSIDVIYTNMRTNASFTNKIKKVNNELSRYSIIVASNNNAAVKNITQELPVKNAIPLKYSNSKEYFKELSDLVLNEDTWGMIAAALGNSKNRYEFSNAVWPISGAKTEQNAKSETFKFNQYLREIKLNKTDEEKISDWNSAINSFKRTKAKLETEQNKMRDIYITINKEFAFKDEINALEEISQQLLDEKKECENAKQLTQKQHDSILIKLDETKSEITFFEKEKKTIKYLYPAYCVFNNKIAIKYKNLKNELDNLILKVSERQLELNTIKHNYDIIVDKIHKNIEEITLKNKQLIEVRTQINNFKKTNFACINGAEKVPCSLPDYEYVTSLCRNGTNERELVHKVVPWNYAKLNEIREELFFDAININRAFVENSGQLQINLDATFKLLRGMLDKDTAARNAETLMQSLFLTVPVVSTTFASVGTFLKYIGKEQIGHLLIDEAGQATPQSAVGSIYRAKKVMVVGDPLQVTPVMTLHDKIIELLKNYYGQPDLISSKETSVQNLSDAINPIGGYRTVKEKNDLWIGSPLLVHGRCRKQIFDISNEIAYSGKMIYDTFDKGKLAHCKWIDVKGSSDNHFIFEQVDAIEKIVTESICNHYLEGKALETLPSLFIITPFRSVKAGISSSFRKNSRLFSKVKARVPEIDERIIRKWISSNIGTIHTFQGKEAKKVIICLGGDSNGRSEGAINWASGTPNLLNVAVSRAKEELIIVGDSSQWRPKPYFSDAYKIINNL